MHTYTAKKTYSAISYIHDSCVDPLKPYWDM